MQAADRVAGGTLSRNIVRVDTRSLVGAVLLGLVFVVVQQLAHRIDPVINPACVIVGGVTWATMTGLVVLLYGQPAGLITAEVAALVALATGLSPLALFFIPANGFGSLAYSLATWKSSTLTWPRHLVAQVVTNVTGNICVAIGLRVILNLPWSVIYVAAAITTAFGIVGGTILTKLVYDNVRKSGLID